MVAGSPFVARRSQTVAQSGRIACPQGHITKFINDIDVQLFGLLLEEGEKQAAEMLAQAANTLSSQGQALQLRYLQTLTEISNETSNTIIFPLPMDLIEAFTDKAGMKASPTAPPRLDPDS